MEAGRITDRYSLDRKIGHGGSGAVWLGRDEILGRTVALKQVGYPPGSVAVDLIRAEREARLAARVNHPNVVAVFDLLETADGYWMVMEYVAGTTLAAEIDQRGPLSPDHTARVMARVADALAAAHAAGIVHRDVKPSNILLGDHSHADTVKLTDFGIARAVADASLTQTGLVTGSPAYLSPEVASGRSATPASDVWSLGASMFHALAGRPPYEIGDNVMGAMYRIVHEDPPTLRSAGWLAPLLEMTMAKDPAQRPAMAEVRDYLKAPGTAHDTQVMPVPAPATAPPTSPPATPPPAGPPQVATTPVSPTPHTDGRDRRAGLLAAAGGGVLALLVLVAAVLLLGNNGDDSPAAHSRSTTGASDSASSSNSGTESGSTSPTTSPPTADELEGFAESYVRTASADPAAGFDQLTPAYQQRSPEYQQFWGSVSGVKVLDVTADPDNMQVTYVYRYHIKGNGSEQHEDRVTLYLVRKGDQLLIADATSSPA